MTEGWVKVYRKILDNPIYQQGNYVRVWLHILLNVNHEDKSIIWNGQKKIVKAGSGIFSQVGMAKELHLGASTVKRCLGYLVGEGQAVTKSTTKFTEITVLNWKAYQETVNKRGTNGDQAVTNKNDKNEKNKKEIDKEKRNEFLKAKEKLTGEKSWE